jgi:hypothetical protein
MTLSSKERVRRAMGSARGKTPLPDRTPLMCQLALGHYFLHSGLAPFDVWYRAEGFAEALIRLQERYSFDGILVNLPGRDPDLERHIDRVERGEGEDIIRWKDGNYSVLPHDDNPHYFLASGERYFPSFEEVDPEALYYVEPWDVTDITYPYTWGFEAEPRPPAEFFPPYHLEPLKAVLERAGSRVSVHAEVFSPFAQLLELLDYERALLALIDDPAKAHACLERLTLGAIDQACRQADCGADAVLISSAFAGAGLISREHYAEFVLPYEKRLTAGFKARHPAVPIYTHTCGSIGDRLDLMLESGTEGIDTLDPPPLGTVELDEAFGLLRGKAFIKGNLDPVGTLLQGTPETALAAAREKLRIAGRRGGYILSTACSVAPATPPQNIQALRRAIEEEEGS